MTINDFYRNCRNTEHLKTEMCRHWKRKIVTWGNSRVSGMKRDSWAIRLKMSWFHSGVRSTRMMMWRGNWKSVKLRWCENAMKSMISKGTIWPWGMKSSLSNSLVTTWPITTIIFATKSTPLNISFLNPWLFLRPARNNLNSKKQSNGSMSKLPFWSQPFVMRNGFQLVMSMIFNTTKRKSRDWKKWWVRTSSENSHFSRQSPHTTMNC